MTFIFQIKYLNYPLDPNDSTFYPNFLIDVYVHILLYQYALNYVYIHIFIQ